MLDFIKNDKTKFALGILGVIAVLLAIKKLFTTYTISNWTKYIVNPLNGKITSGFGNRTNPITRVPNFHNGTDISARLDTAIVAPLNGVVSAKYTNNAGGNQLIIDSGYPRFGFAHLNRYAEGIEVGSVVSRGQVIGYVGDTGISTGTHLHFTLRLNDAPTDPAKYFTFR